MDSLRRLGTAIAEAQDREGPAVDLQAQRVRFLERATKREQRRPAKRVAAYAVFAAAAAALLFFLLRAPSLSFEIAGTRGRPGDWIAAPPDSEIPIRFSDGSEVVLERDAGARVVEVGSKGAVLVVERGTLRADVVHRDDTEWQVNAGPFEVHVVGTRFDVAWDPSREAFSLILHEGAVRVVGPMGDSGRVVRAGERLDIQVGEASPTSSLPAATAVASAAEVPSAAHTASTEGSSSASAEVVVAPSASASWRSLADKGDNRAAWAAIEAEGVDVVMRRSNAAELVSLSDVARFAGRPAHASAALNELRKRFPKDPAAADAAFLLGRMAFDQRGAPSSAAVWFETYLREKPSGAFAREAMGRLLECYQKNGSNEAARTLAMQYVASYPKGPHAELARRIVDEAPAPSPSSEQPIAP
ncbi:MAG: tetratricopeptide repeat protein [Polyangiaceae bacterium]|nr:tetratricopeptide repeat protein [Polyangiaceae bacterium]